MKALSALVCSFALAVSAAHAVHYIYDDNNQLVSVSYDGAEQAVYSFDAAGNLTGIVLRGVVSKAAYYGLITPPLPDAAKTGAITVNLTGKRTFTAVLKIGGKRYALQGQFSELGEYSGQIARSGLAPLDVELVLDIVDGADRITGTIEEGGVLFAWIGADQAAFNGKTRRSGDAGAYTVLLPADPLHPEMENTSSRKRMAAWSDQPMQWSGPKRNRR